MTKLQLLPFIAALCLALSGTALTTPKFNIQGKVYCDTCRAGFETTISKSIAGAKVRLECKEYETGVLKQTADDVTDDIGMFNIEVADNHDEEICKVVLVSSPQPACSEIVVGRECARILLSTKSGLVTPIRYANSLGFFKDVPLLECGHLLQQYALGVDD